MHQFTAEQIDLDANRARITRMTDDELRKYGPAAAWMVGRSDRETWVVQLQEARAEWWRRRDPCRNSS